MAGRLIQRLEDFLIAAARQRCVLTYADVARALELKPPHTIHQVTELVEVMMRLHAREGAPQLASLVVSRARSSMPAPGYFLLLGELGLYDGPSQGAFARHFHAIELARCYNSI